MAIIYKIGNFNGSAELDLNDDANVKALAWNEERDFSHTPGSRLVYKTIRLKISGSSAAVVRSNLNTLTEYLKRAREWKDDPLLYDSYWLYEKAEGETNYGRRLIDDYKLKGVTYGAFTPFQGVKDEIFVDLVLTLQNHRERILFTELTKSSVTTLPAQSLKFLLSGHTATRESRAIISALTTESNVESFHIGLMEYNGSSFVHKWDLEDGVSQNGAVDSGAGYVEVTDTAFDSQPAMLRRVAMGVRHAYVSNYAQCRGTYVGVMRYSLTGSSGNIYGRLGIAFEDLGDASFNEPVLLDGSSGIVSLGTISFPPKPYRYETQASAGRYQWSLYDLLISLEIQRISGDRGIRVYDITWIPYQHYLRVDNSYGTATRPTYIFTHEDWSTESFVASSVTPNAEIFKQGTVTYEHNWAIPRIKNTYVQGVMVADFNVTGLGTWNLYEGIEGYGV